MPGPIEPTDVCPLTTDAALHRACTIAPDNEAVVTAAGRITFAELDEQVRNIRSALAASGVQRGDHVAVCLGNGPRWVAVFLAIGSLGAVTVPINTRFQADEFGYTLRQSRASTLLLADRFLSQDFIAMLRQVCPGIDSALPDQGLPDLRQVVVLGKDVPAAASSWPRFLETARAQVPASCTPDDVLLIQYTSGTTSCPKGVLLTHRSMCADAFFSGLRMGLRAGDRFHSARPFFHVSGSTLSVLSSLQHATTLVTMDRFEPAEALRLMELERCTHFSGNDTMALMLLGHPDRDTRNLRLRGAWLAASPTIVRRVAEELGVTECVVGYGLSEASPNVAQSCWWEDVDVRFAGRMLPEPGVDVRIRDSDSDADTPLGQTGEIQVRGWNVTRGYYEMPEQTAAAFTPDGWLRTGDLGRLDSDGRLEFAGRAKDLIRVGGENVSPAEVEDMLHKHPKIRQAAVVGVPDDRLLEVPFAFVTLVDSADVDADELLDWACSQLARFKVPRHLHIVDDFERIGMTASAKVQKRHLADFARKLLSAEPVK